MPADVKAGTETSGKDVYSFSMCDVIGKKFVADMSNIPEENLGEALEAAVREAVDDKTFRKIKRCSYAQGPQDTLSQLLGKAGGTGNSNTNQSPGNLNVADPAILDQLMTALLGQQAGQSTSPHQAFNRMSRMSRMSRSMRQSTRHKNEASRRSSWMPNQNQGGEGRGGGGGGSNGGGGNNDSSGHLPTIMEGSGLRSNPNNTRTLSLSQRALNAPVVRNILQSLSNVPQNFNVGNDDEESGGRRGRLGRRNSETPLTRNQFQ